MATIAEYPVLGQVEVMLPGASALIASLWSQIESERARIEGRPATAPVLVGSSPERSAARFQRLWAAEEANLAAIECAARPIVDYLGEERSVTTGISGALALQGAGYDAPQLLPYFYQDWGESSSLGPVRDYVAAAVDDLSSDRSSVAVLGCGAGGLAHGLADRFTTVVAVDLSVTGMLLVDHYLGGEDLRLSVHRGNLGIGDFPLVTLHGPRPARNLELVAANAVDLPFPDGSLSCVVTQYLVDIVPDAGALATEINRVLAPGGVWINFGMPFRLVDDPPALRGRDVEDTAELLPAFGFEPLRCSWVQHRFMNLEALSIQAVARIHPCVCFAARKREALAVPADRAAFAAYARGESRAVLDFVPRLRDDHAARCLVGAESQGGRTRLTTQVTVGNRPLTTLAEPETSPHLVSVLIHGCLQRLDGVASAGEVFAALQLDTSGLLAEADFVMALRFMRILGWIELAPPPL